MLSQQELPMFYQDWYLDVVCRGSHWTPYMLVAGDRLLAIWICNTKRKVLLTTSLQPELTPYSGLFVVDHRVDTSQLEELRAAVLADHHIVVQDLHPSSPHLQGCTPRRTFIIPAHTSVAEAYADMKSDYRRTIKKAKELSTLSAISFDQFRAILEQSFEQKGKPNPFPMDLFARIDRACSVAQRRTLVGIADTSGVLQGAAYFMHDSYSWYFMAGASLDIKYGVRYLIAHGIEQALTQALAFDFEGSSIPSIAQFFKGFGGKPIDYPSLTYTSGPLAKAALSAKHKIG